MKRPVLQMALCTLLLFSPSLFATEDSDSRFAQLYREHMPPDNRPMSICPKEVLAHTVSFVRFRDLQSLLCTSRTTRLEILKHLQQILALASPRWSQRTQFLCLKGLVFPFLAGGDPESQERAQILYELESLEARIPLSHIEKFQLFLKPAQFKSDRQLAQAVAAYLSRMPNLQKLTLEVGNVDDVDTWRTDVETMLLSLPYLESCSQKVES